jgi:hypothetical protein
MGSGLFSLASRAKIDEISEESWDETENEGLRA